MNRRQLIKFGAMLLAVPESLVKACGFEKGGMVPTADLNRTVSVTIPVDSVPLNPVSLLYEYLCGVIPTDKINHRSFEEGIKFCQTTVRRSGVPMTSPWGTLIYLCEESNTAIMFNHGRIELLTNENDVPVYHITPDDLVPLSSTSKFIGTEQTRVRIYVKMNRRYTVGDHVELLGSFKKYPAVCGRIISLHDCYSESAVCLLIKLA